MRFDLALISVLIVSLLLSFFKVPYLDFVIPLINFIALVPIILSAFKALKNKEITVDLLAVVALTFSFIAREWNSALFINLMIASARIFAKWTEKRTEDAVNSLLKYKPASIKVKSGKGYIIKKPEEIKVGDIMIVMAGERIATDGIIVGGTSAVDESTITGESIPRSVDKGDLVYSSSLNTDGVIEIKVTKEEKESTLAKIILSVENASLKKSKTIRTSSIFASYYVVFTLVGSILIYLFTRSTNFTLSILLVVCADDLAVSIPLAFTLGIAQATRRGILIRSADVIEKLPKIKYLITDKTGTLTKAQLKIKEIANLSAISPKKILSLLASIEMNSKNPVSVSIFNYAKQLGIIPKEPSSYIEYPGDGAEMKNGKDKYLVGKISFLLRHGVRLTKAEKSLIEDFSLQGFSTSFLAQGRKIISIIVFQDEVKTNVKDVVAKTKQLGIEKWIMLTGDNNLIAKKVALESGVDEFESGFTPSAKMKYLENLKKDKRVLIGMIGDGVNDAPALSLADVSIAMGMIGSDTAIEASDISIMNDNLEKIPEVIKISRKVRSIVSDSVLIWVITNAIGLGLVINGNLNPTGAATYNFLTDLITTFNVFRLLKK